MKNRRKPSEPKERRGRFKLDEQPDERDIERSWASKPDSSGSGKWTERAWQLVITLIAAVMILTLVITLLPPCTRRSQKPVEPEIETQTGYVTHVTDGPTIMVTRVRAKS